MISIAHKSKAIQNKVKLKKAKCEDAEKNHQRILTKLFNLNKQISKAKKEYEEERAERDKLMGILLLDYERKERLRQCARIEKEKQATLARHKEKVLKINDLEKKLSSLKQEDLINEEQSRIEGDIEKQEQKFALIQKAINVATIDDIIAV